MDSECNEDKEKWENFKFLREQEGTQEDLIQSKGMNRRRSVLPTFYSQELCFLSFMT